MSASTTDRPGAWQGLDVLRAVGRPGLAAHPTSRPASPADVPTPRRPGMSARVAAHQASLEAAAFGHTYEESVAWRLKRAHQLRHGATGLL